MVTRARLKEIPNELLPWRMAAQDRINGQVGRLDPKNRLMNQNLVQQARHLRLSGLLSSLELRLEEARTHQLPHEQFLELVFQDELNIRHQRLIDKRKKASGFRDQKTLEDFDWTFNPTIKRQPIYELATGQFIRQAVTGRIKITRLGSKWWG